MAQPYLNLANVYRVRIQKHGSEDTSDIWRNEWDVEYPAGVFPTASDAVLADLLTFERFLSYPDVIFDTTFVDDYHVGPAGTNPTFQLTVPLANLPGTALTTGGMQGQSGGPVGGEVCLVVNRSDGLTRRHGRLFIRGALQKNDVASSAGGEWVILNNAQFPAAFAQLVVSFINPHLGAAGAQPVLRLVHSHRTPGSRTIILLTHTGITTVTLPLVVATNKINRRSRR